MKNSESIQVAKVIKIRSFPVRKPRAWLDNLSLILRRIQSLEYSITLKALEEQTCGSWIPLDISAEARKRDGIPQERFVEKPLA